MKVEGERILVKKIQETKTSGGLIIPTVGRTNKYKVVQVGEKITSIKAGDNVIVPNQGVEVVIENEPHFIVNAQDVYLIFNDNELV